MLHIGSASIPEIADLALFQHSFRFMVTVFAMYVALISGPKFG
jgi:hypothetical protein